ncbi:hypothetical protein [Streptomyces sp. NPDC056600]|uniref:hypothetical protein n=1 Tax=Streptomyces sp. NPDC056600 TaxID=3345874 RepID=UPI0036C0B670
MLGLLGFYDELDRRPGQPNGSVHDAIRDTGEPDEAELVAYLDAGHVLIDVMEGGHDVVTGRAHRRSAGCSSPVTDGTWLWRLDFPHYVETHHVALPGRFLEHVRGLRYRMPPLVTARFGPLFDATMPLVGWASAVPWPVTTAVVEPEVRDVMSRREWDAMVPAQARNRPHGAWTRPRKPRRA